MHNTKTARKKNEKEKNLMETKVKCEEILKEQGDLLLLGSSKKEVGTIGNPIGIRREDLCAEWEQNAPQLKCQEVSAHSSPSM
jgi:hypothetical protein